MSVDDLHEGEGAVLTGFGGDLPQGWKRRFEDLGLLPDTTVTMGARAPLGDPVQLRVRGTVLCLRRAEARLIEVRRG